MVIRLTTKKDLALSKCFWK